MAAASSRGVVPRLAAVAGAILALGWVGAARAEPAAAPPPPAQAAPTSWATVRAAELTGEAERLRQAGAVADALVRLREALAMDATYEPAYLALAAAREATGDLREAEQVLSMAVERVPSFALARERRAALREKRGDRTGAARDLDAALADRPTDLALHARVSEAWIAAGQVPRALATARRWLAVATDGGDAASITHARRVAAACAWIVDRADPVTATEGRGGVRAALAAAARRATGGPPRPNVHGTSIAPPRSLR